LGEERFDPLKDIAIDPHCLYLSQHDLVVHFVEGFREVKVHHIYIGFSVQQ
jgi:hypothetical protein